MTEPSNDWDDYPAPHIPYVPTTQVVRDAYVRAMRNAFIASADEHRQEFDRWLEQQRSAAWAEGYLLATGGMMHDQNPYEASDG